MGIEKKYCLKTEFVFQFVQNFVMIYLLPKAEYDIIFTNIFMQSQLGYERRMGYVIY